MTVSSHVTREKTAPPVDKRRGFCLPRRVAMEAMIDNLDEGTMTYQSKTPQGQSKVERYNWVSLDAPGEFMMISKYNLIIPTDEYQRDGSHAKVKRIASRFSWPAFQVLSVVDAGGGKFNVIEGGHRTRAAMMRSDVDEVPCMVFKIDTVRDEAKAFLEVNTNRRPMTAVDRHKAYLVSGDKTAAKVEDLVKYAGREISASQGPKQLSCVNELRTSIDADEEAFRRAWPIIVGLCDGRKITRDIVIGLFYLERRVDGGISSAKRGRRIMEDVGFNRILDGARQGREYHGNPGARAIADGMIKEINKGLRNKWVFSDV